MKHLSSRDNPTFRHLRALAEEARYRREQGRTVIDGAHLLRAALDAGVAPTMTAWVDAPLDTELAALQQRCADAGVPAISLPPNLFKVLSPVDAPTGVLAEIVIPDASGDDGALVDVIALEGVQDAGNLGTLLRTAAAAGIRHAWLGEGCAQAWSPKVLRAGMGAHFLLGIRERVDLSAQIAAFAGARLATVLADDAQTVFDCDLRGPVCWLFGAEGRGLSPALAALATRRVFIPMPGGAESLNVAAAAAVCLFEQVRQRRQG
ncbi:TrmH family RNA methyltransferase [Uliginosibacterium sp. H1]|uniref:TrmH family RNA methyltransferase n=1 Tax=Uliginosibacterium sp. H1 TaxID=3114757 RepID=UPI002E179405|nr:RNA methyltransferase [Uliginosibacterium sp. H1]